MKKYTEMTSEEIRQIVNRGGDKLVKLNQQVGDYLDSLDLSDRARKIITNTDERVIAECFGGLMSAEEIEKFIKEEYPIEE